MSLFDALRSRQMVFLANGMVPRVHLNMNRPIQYRMSRSRRFDLGLCVLSVVSCYLPRRADKEIDRLYLLCPLTENKIPVCAAETLVCKRFGFLRASA